MSALNTICDSGSIHHRQVLALDIIKKLEDCGFEEAFLGEGERIYQRAIPDTGINVRVYTSVVGMEARESGRDAIRVCAVYDTRDGDTRGIGSSTRVHRTGDIHAIVDRMHQRMRLVWKDAATGERCTCGAPKFKAKSGNFVCADICWLSDEEKKASQYARKTKSVRGTSRNVWQRSRKWTV